MLPAFPGPGNSAGFYLQAIWPARRLPDPTIHSIFQDADGFLWIPEK
jgi:hypothetical protein